MPNRYYGYYDADPTQPPNISSLPHASYGKGAIGTIPSGASSDWRDSFDSQVYRSGPPQGSIGTYQGNLGVQGKVPRTGAIGEVSQASNVRAVLTDSPPVQQRVARINLGGSEGSSQLQVYRKPETVRPGGQVIGQYNLQPGRSNVGQYPGAALQSSRGGDVSGRSMVGPTSGGQGVQGGNSMYSQPPRSTYSSYGAPSGPAIGTIPTSGPPTLPSAAQPAVGTVGSIPGPQSSYGAPTSSYGNQQYYVQPQFGSQQSYQHQPLIGRMSSNTGSGVIGRYNSAPPQQLTSPFTPASTGGHPITSRPLSRFPEDFATDDMMNQMSTGNLSALESVSQFGSISQTGSVENPAASQAGGSRNLSGLASKVKAVCSSGGHFVKLDGGGLEYEGGETRLVQIPNFCHHQELLEALERLAGFGHQSSSESSGGGAPSLKYQLPTEPNVYVDLVDDTDTELMFDEWNDFTSKNRTSSAKLHLFVDWLRPGSERKDQLRSAESANSLGQVPQSHSAGSAVNSADEARADQNSAEYRSTQTAMNTSQDSDIDQKLKERMEVISPQEVTLVKFLGSGGYGEVYLGKWQHSEAAVKCLNPSLFFTGGLASKNAKDELMREAALLGSLRHPNVVWVYGIVLPGQPQADEDEDHSGSDNSDVEPMPPRRGNVPQHVRPPAIITEYMSQGSVKIALQRKTDIVKGALMRVLIAMDAAKGMEYLHSKNIVHFDLKSANLLLGWRDRRAICKVADFGLSKQKRETFVSNVSSQRGTLPWIAPEIIKNPNTVNEKVDVFSFGVVLWELWTGKEPYDGLNYHALYHQMTTSDKSLRPSLPGSPDWDPSVGPEPAPGYQALMERCWSESPYGRPSFNQIVKALKEMASSLRPSKKSSKGPPNAATP